MTNPVRRLAKTSIKQSPALYRVYLTVKNNALRWLHRPLQVMGIKYMPPADLLGEARRVRQNSQPIRPGEKPRILFFSLRGWADHLMWETTLAHALQLRGARCEIVACDHILPVCDTKTITDTSPALCDYCGRLAQNLPATFGLPVHRLSRFALEGIARMKARANGDAAKVAAQTVAGLRLGDAIGASLARFTLTGNAAPTDPETTSARNGFLASAEFLAEACRAMLDQLRPDRIVMLNGLFLPEQILMALALERSIPALTYEQGNKIRNTLIFAWNRPANREMLTEPWSHYQDIPLTQAQEDQLDRYVLERAGGSVGSERLWPKMQADRHAMRAQLGLDERPLISVFTNILWDTSMYQTQVAFPSMFDWLKATLTELGPRSDVQVVVRIHPAEIRVKNRESRDRVLDRIRATFSGLPEHIHVVRPEEGLSSYTLIEMSRAVTIYNTTIGLEAALRGVPVALSALAHFRGKGFTTDIESPQHYHDWLAQLPNVPPLTAEQQMLARRYAHLFFFRFMLPFRFVEMHAYAPRLTYQTLDELAPGQDKYLDLICDGILNVRPILYLGGVA